MIDPTYHDGRYVGEETQKTEQELDDELTYITTRVQLVESRVREQGTEDSESNANTIVENSHGYEMTARYGRTEGTHTRAGQVYANDNVYYYQTLQHYLIRAHDDWLIDDDYRNYYRVRINEIHEAIRTRAGVRKIRRNRHQSYR